MKHWMLLLVLCGSVALAACGKKSAASDDIVARVDDKDITATELERQYQIAIRGAEQPLSPSDAQDQRFQVLGQMISDRVLLGIAEKAKLTATDAEVDVKYNDSFKGQFTEEAFQESLKRENLTVDDLRANIRKELTLEKLVNKEITSKISVSDVEIKEFYDKNKKAFDLPPGFHVAHILVTPFAEQVNPRPDDAKSPEEALRKASRLLKDVQGGRDFAVIARDSSEDVDSARNGGDLNFTTLDNLANLDPRLASAVQRLKIGETAAELVPSKYGFHIVKLLDKDPGGQKEISDPRIQAQIRQAIFERKGQTLRAAFLEVARNGSKVENFMAERLLTKAGEAAKSAPASAAPALPAAPAAPATQPVEPAKPAGGDKK